MRTDLTERYLALLLEANAKMNLTAVRDPGEIRVRHFEDSLRLLEAADFHPQSRVLDVGSGAGFPGLMLKIARPGIVLTLLDATEKKVRFLRSVCCSLGFPDVSCVHGRAEELAHDAAYRERYDIVTARGVAALPALCELCLPFVRIGGVFLAMKEAPETISDGVSTLGGEQGSPFRYTLSDGRSHSVCRFAKIHRTPDVFPRSWAKLKKTGSRG